MEKVDLVLVGAEGVVESGGIINKVRCWIIVIIIIIIVIIIIIIIIIIISSSIIIIIMVTRM